MIEYVKVRPYVAQRLGVLMLRSHYPDGCVQLWFSDMKEIDREWIFHKEETLARIGGILLDPYQSKEEQQKSAEECTPLPVPQDPMWREPEGVSDSAPEEEDDAEEDKQPNPEESAEQEGQQGSEGSGVSAGEPEPAEEGGDAWQE